MLLVSRFGRGPSDIGTCRIAACTREGDDFAPGPMAVLIDQVTLLVWGSSPLDSAAMIFSSESELRRRAGASKPLPKPLTLPGPKRAQETGFYDQHAQA